MDLLGDDPVFNLYDDDWRIYSRSEIRPPHYIGMNGKVANIADIAGLARYDRA